MILTIPGHLPQALLIVSVCVCVCVCVRACVFVKKKLEFFLAIRTLITKCFNVNWYLLINYLINFISLNYFLFSNAFSTFVIAVISGRSYARSNACHLQMLY